MAGLRRSFRWSSENKKTMTIAVPRSEAGFGFTVAWTKPPLVDYIHEGGNAEKAGLLPGDKIITIDKIKVTKKGKEEIESIVKNAKEIMELDINRPDSDMATRKRQLSLRRKESFTKKGSKMIIQDCNIMLWRRERAMLKLLLCEEDLLSAISLGKDRFIQVLRKHCALATPMDLNILFGNIEEVGSVHERFVQQLRHMTQGNDDSVGRLYQKQLDDRCSVLKTYIYGLHLAKILLRYKLSNRPFRALMEKQENADGSLEIIKFIEKPVQYLTDVTTQLETLLSCTAVGHRDYVCLESVLSVYQNFGREMNEVMSKLSSFVDFDTVESPYDNEDPYINLETLQEKAIFTKGPRDFSLVYPGRYWLFSGELSKIEGRHYVQYWALLLSDCLILARRTEQRVLLVLDEPVMLRSIYQATFDVKKCDTEFRILFALEKPKKSAGKRSQWLTWILRAPSVGVKLLWQTILTYQLSLYSTEALSSGSKASFVHARPLPGVKELASQKNIKYEESSFVTLSEALQNETIVPQATKVEETKSKQFDNFDPKVGKYIFPLAKKADLMREVSERKNKEGSFFSLNENAISSNDSEDIDQHVFLRSKSFGNDITDVIPFIDSGEENSNQKHGTQNNEVSEKQNDKTQSENEDGENDLKNNEAESHSAPDTPDKYDKYVQTDDSSESTDVKRTPKRRFPRLGTFERIKVEKKNASEIDTSIPMSPSHTRTGTSSKHRRFIKTTTSKELLLKSTSSDAVSPTKEEKISSDMSPEPPIPEKKKSKGIFSRLFRRDSKASDLEKSEVNSGDVQLSNLDETLPTERPPDYESAVNSANQSWVNK